MRETSPIFSTITSARADGLTAAEIERRVWERHSVTCALLALDSSGMTRFTRAYGIVEFLTRYKAMLDLAEVILNRHACLAWRCFADNLFAEFRTVPAALAAAREIHRGIRAADLRIGGVEPFHVCIGIGYGRVLDDGSGGKLGDEMNVVAKLGEDVAEAGQTLLTEAAFGQIAAPAAVAVERRTVRLAQVDLPFYLVRE